ncbi:MAG: 5'-nucleotidase C-terminal domain-containing protein, partial [Clostridia bacterium]|nr:5'-nucleotidase C-terminal domain-containing protein [Clostridia bacterium]
YTFSSDTFFEVQKNVLEARAKGADYVVVLSHLGSTAGDEPYTASQLAAETVGIDAVLDAHSHVTYNTDVKNKKGENVLIASTGTKLENMGRLEISSDGELSNTLISAEEYKEKDAEVQAVIDSKNKDIDEKTNQKVGKTDYLLSISDESGTRMVRTRETNCGDFVADAYRYAGEADIGIANGGGVRDKINIGDITYKNLLSVVPYGNQLCKVKVTGQQIADALEFAYKNTQSEYSDGPNAVGEFGGFIQVSGLKYTVDTSVPSSVQTDENFMFTGVSGDRRVKDIMVEKDGSQVPLDMNEEYIVAGTAYLILEHGDGHTAFDGCTVLSNDFSVDVDALVSYLVDGLGGTVDSRYAAPQGRITVK